MFDDIGIILSTYILCGKIYAYTTVYYYYYYYILLKMLASNC